MFQRKGLAFKLSVYLLTAVLLILLALLYYNYIISRNLALKDAQGDAQKLTELSVLRIENILQNVENIPINLASVIESKDTVVFMGLRKIIEQVLENNDLLYGASIAFAPQIHKGDTLYFAPYIYSSGDSVVFKNLAGEDYNYTSMPWYTKAQEAGEGVWSEPYFDKGGGEALMATYSMPFYRETKDGPAFNGVVTADISLRGLQIIIEGIEFYESGRAFLISSAGNIVTYPDIFEWDSTNVYNVFDMDHNPAMLEVLNKMVLGEKGIMSLRGVGARKNNDSWITYLGVPSTRWSLGIIFDEHELYASIHQLYLKLIAIGLAGFIILAILIFQIASRFVRPIERLAFATRKIGAGEFNFNIPSFKSKDEISQLGNSFRMMQQELQDYIVHLKETTARNEKMESELKIANNIQQQMLPKESAMGDSGKIDYYGILRPAKSVGGDLYDFIVKGDELYFAIGDVAGKGIPAALFMAKTLTLFRAKVTGERSPAKIASEINDELEQYNEQSMFVTFFIGKLNLSSGKLLYTNAGHNLPYLSGEGGTLVNKLPGVHGLPLGSMPEMHYKEGVGRLNPGDRLVLFTDGITEAENESHQLYGDSRLAGLIQSNPSGSPETLAKMILDDVDAFAGPAEQFDDITMLILEYK
jgi:sigma-B regulation protein RsbU (phosphoserine phosphatase)